MTSRPLYHTLTVFKFVAVFDDQNVQYFNGGAGDYFNIIREELETDSNSWQTSAANLFEVGSYGTNDQVNVISGNYGATNWAGLTNPTHVDNCFIDAGEALLNTFYLESVSRDLKKAAACHEVGHLLGIDHIANSSCMEAQLGNGASFPTSYEFNLVDEIYCTGCPTIALQAFNNQWVVAEGGGGGFTFSGTGPLNANRSSVGNWETFRMRDLGGGYVALQSYTGQWVVAENGGGGNVNSDRARPGTWETFFKVDLGNGYVAFRTHDGHYLNAELGGGFGVYAVFTSIDAYSTFRLVYQ